MLFWDRADPVLLVHEHALMCAYIHTWADARLRLMSASRSKRAYMFAHWQANTHAYRHTQNHTNAYSFTVCVLAQSHISGMHVSHNLFCRTSSCRVATGYRYPRGESYLDVFQRLDTIVHELERQRDPVLIIAHQVHATRKHDLMQSNAHACVYV